MKIGAFYSDNPFAGWVQTEGFADVLKRMGHDVVGIPVPCCGQPITKAQVEKINKPIDDCDLLIVSGPEWLAKWIRTFYTDWKILKAPKVGWYHESFVRDDFTLDYANYEELFDFHFFPDKADAEKYKGEFLPLGVDTHIFHSHDVISTTACHCSPFQFEKYDTTRDVDVGFVGLMYEKRAKFMEQVRPHLGDIKIQARFPTDRNRVGYQIPAIAVYDFDGINVRRSMQLLAETYRRIKVFVTFPAMSNVVVAKVLETLACGCALVAPEQPVTLPGCFEYSGPYQCAEQIRNALKCHGKYTDTPKRIHDLHRMELRFEQIFAKVGLCVPS